MLTETIKNFLKSDTKEPELSSNVSKDNTIVDMTDDTYTTFGSFFDNEGTGYFSDRSKIDILERQKQKIMTYRNLAKTPDVHDAIEEIVNEVSFSLNGKRPLKISIDEENKKIEEKIINSFDKIMSLMNVERNIYNIIKNPYIDGQMNFHCGYGKTITDGIKSIKLIEPVYLYFDKKKNVFRYHAKQDANFFARTQISKDQEYSPEELVREDFGLYEDGLCISYLDYAIKTANQLRTLEDLLIPMRFSRSISRRIFNVDVGDLPNKKAEESMREIQNKFKYKKFYNVSTGEVSNQQHITSMVEDYWFANRSGGKGTTADILDETGNLGELNDILYFNKKLYKSLFIPSNRISINPEGDSTFDYDTTSVSKEDIKFFMFVSRLRAAYISAFKEILRRELISTKTITVEDWEDYKEKIEISFINENAFIEKMNLNNLMSKLDIYATASEHATKIFPVEKILKDIFKYSTEEVEELLKDIDKESKNPLYAKFYKEDEF